MDIHCERESQTDSAYYVMVTYDQVCVTDNPDELLNALHYRWHLYCDVAVLKTAEEAQTYAINRYYTIFFSNPYLYRSSPLLLPVQPAYNIRDHLVVNDTHYKEGISLYGLPEENFSCTIYALPKEHHDVIYRDIYWSIDGINGYGVEHYKDRLINTLLYSGLVYAHATSCDNETYASAQARNMYLSRFLGRYGYNEKLYLPEFCLRSGQVYIDDDYPNRETRLETNTTLNQLRAYGIF